MHVYLETGISYSYEIEFGCLCYAYSHLGNCVLKFLWENSDWESQGNLSPPPPLCTKPQFLYPKATVHSLIALQFRTTNAWISKMWSPTKRMRKQTYYLPVAQLSCIWCNAEASSSECHNTYLRLNLDPVAYKYALQYRASHNCPGLNSHDKHQSL